MAGHADGVACIDAIITDSYISSPTPVEGEWIHLKQKVLNVRANATHIHKVTLHTCTCSNQLHVTQYSNIAWKVEINELTNANTVL